MQLASPRLLLRSVKNQDLADLFRIYGDPATNQFNPAGPYPDEHYSELVLSRWLDHWHRHGFGNWAITLIDNPDNVIGFGGLSIREYKNLTINNLGYRFETQVWGKGLATEFSRRAIQFGFEDLKLKNIAATVRENHLASQAVLLKSGLYPAGKINDVPGVPASLMFKITSDEYDHRLRNSK